MRRINKDFKRPPKTLVEGFQEQLPSLKKKKERHSFSGRVYHDATIQPLRKLYHDKCAYCERKLYEGQFTVEHYRPKKKENHPYYWLGYEWSNLILACKSCNNQKDDAFPIFKERKKERNAAGKSVLRSARASCSWEPAEMHADHPHLLAERPLLIHPEVDEPERLLRVNRAGRLVASTEAEGDLFLYRKVETTVDKVLSLNRDELMAKRVAVIQQLRKILEEQTLLLLKVASSARNDEVIALAYDGLFKAIEKAADLRSEYSLVGYQIWQNVEACLFRPLAEELENPDILSLLQHALALYIEKRNP